MRLRDFKPSGSQLLIAAALLALAAANTPLADDYNALWRLPLRLQVGGFNLLAYGGRAMTLLDFVNDLLMALFFFNVAYEVRLALRPGAPLANARVALLPVMGALGGVLTPMLVYLVFCWGTPAEHGLAIPMATDIAFSLGVLSAFGRRVPQADRLFLSTLAIADDVLGILVIAVFYSSHLSAGYLSVAAGLVLILWLLRRARVSRAAYALLSLLLWYLFLQSGVHATMAGVLLAFLLPYLPASLERRLQGAVSYFILPLFALANAGISLSGGSAVEGPVLFGVMLGLILGKPVGVTLFARLSAWMGATRLPAGFTQRHLLGMALLSGIGFTVSLFIAHLSFEGNALLLHEAKLGILSGALVSGVVGYFYLRHLYGR